MNDLLLTWMSGKEFVKGPGVKVFLKSAQEKLTCDKVVLTNISTLGCLPSIWYDGYDVMTYDDNLVKNILRDRWYVFWRYLSEHRNISRVFICDCKDVYFQDDIFAKLPGNDLQFFSEGMSHAQSEFNLLDQFKYQLGLGDWASADFKNWSVLNAGTIFGSKSLIENFCMYMWLACMKMEQKYTDQAVFNFLASHLSVVLHEPEYSSLVVTGEGVKQGFVKVIDSDGVYKNVQGNTYCVFHQWDRTEFASAIVEKYAKS